MKKKLKIIIPIILLTIVIVSYVFYQKMMKPIYAPGNVSKGIHLSSSLIPPKQMTNTETMWQVETDIYLNYFTQGEGRNVLIIHGIEKLQDSEGDFIYKETESIKETACVLFSGDYSGNSLVFNFIGKWLEENDYSMEGKARELIIKGPWTEQNSEDYLTEIQIPICK